MMLRYRAFFFDMDGTILDSVGFHTAYLQWMLDKVGVIMSEEAIKPHLGVTLQFVLDRLVPREHHAQALVEAKRFMQVEAERYLDRFVPIAGAFEVCGRLRSAGRPVLLVTNSPDFLVREVARKLALSSHFDGIFPAKDGDVSKRERCLCLMERYRLQGSQVLYVGDSSHDMRLARETGMDGCLLRNRYSWIHFEAGYNGGPVPCAVELTDIRDLPGWCGYTDSVNIAT